jgi:hypothetical protein
MSSGISRIDELRQDYPGLNLKLSWLPRNCSFVGFRRAKQLALEAIRTANLEEVEEPQSTKSQKASAKPCAKQQAYRDWTERWLAYRTALTKPPDGRLHPAFKAPQGGTPPEQSGVLVAAPPGRAAKRAKFSRASICTLYWIITGHAFVGAYAQRFYPNHTPEQIACPCCGEPIQTIELSICSWPVRSTTPRAASISRQTAASETSTNYSTTLNGYKQS